MSEGPGIGGREGTVLPGFIPKLLEDLEEGPLQGVMILLPELGQERQKGGSRPGPGVLRCPSPGACANPRAASPSYLLPHKNKASKRKTPVVKKTLNPHYNHTFVYNGINPEELQHLCLELTVWDREPLASNDFLGGVRLGVGNGEEPTGPSHPGAAVLRAPGCSNLAEAAMLWAPVCSSCVFFHPLPQA